MSQYDIDQHTHANRATTALSRDQAFEMLSNRRRRWVLYYLEDHGGGPVDLRSLVDTVSAWEHDTSIDELSWKKRKRVYTALRQSHLPKMERAGAIEYDADRGQVALTDEARTLQLYLEYVPERDIPWHQYYLGLAAIASALTAVTWLSVPPFDGLGGLALAGVVTGMLVISATVHAYHARQSRLGTLRVPPR